ncbi:MAG: hypothetical protein IBX56_18480, partial [Methylomicrobium sp.]|nr:hypothetical protein [Methylomicrobium sp.]
FKPEPEDLDELSVWLFRALKTNRKLLGQRSINNLVKNRDTLNFNQLASDFYHHSYKFNVTMTAEKNEPKRVTPEMVSKIWAKRKQLTNGWRNSEHQAQQAPSMAWSIK